jgi:glutamyl-tRNA reductase
MLTFEPGAITSEAAMPLGRLNWLSSFWLIGLNYRSASAETRCAVSFEGDSIGRLVQALKGIGCGETLILSTCNRTEIYFYRGDPEAVFSVVAELTEVTLETLRASCYELSGLEAVRHLFRVASGLDSAVLGEHEVLGQLKKAHAVAKKEGALEGALDHLVQRSFRVGKRVRHESNLSKGVTSVAAVAMRKAAKLAGGLEGKNVLIVGAGQIAERVAKSISHIEGVNGFICNRTHHKAEDVAKLNGLGTWDYSDLEGGLRMADVVVGAISSPVPKMSLDQIAAARQGQPTVVVDLGVPPNFAPPSLEETGLKLLEMESIVGACRQSSDGREASVPKANLILDEELAKFEQEIIEREAAPYIGALAKTAEKIRKKNLAWALAQSPEVGEKERKLLEDLSIRIVRGMMETPIQALKSDLREPAERAIVARLFAPGALPE